LRELSGRDPQTPPGSRGHFAARLAQAEMSRMFDDVVCEEAVSVDEASVVLEASAGL
jgi:hypothetical protein